jgi:hypothetical protein
MIFISAISFSQTLNVNLINGSNVPTIYDIVYSVEDFSIPTDGYLQLIINGQSPTIYNTENSGNITVESMVGTDAISLELLDSMGNSLSPQIIYNITINVLPTTNVITLAELRAGTIGDFYKFTGEAFLTFQQSLRNQKYIQEGIDGIITGMKIDDPNGLIISSVSLLDGMSQIVGQLTDFHGILQFQPYSSNLSLNSGGSVSVDDSTLSNLLTNWENYESELIGFPSDSYSFVNTVPAQLFEVNTNYTITDGSTNLTFRTLFADADYIGTLIPISFNALNAIVSEYDGVPQVTARELSDFIGVTLSNGEVNIDSFSVYPNPASSGFINIASKNGSSINVKVYNVLGKKIMDTKTIENKLNISTLNSGMYILKLSQGRKITTKKIIVE